MIADLDNDCLPEIIIKSTNADSILIIDSKSGSSLNSFPKYVSDNDLTNVVIVDVDGDSYPEIINYHGKSGLMYPPAEADRLICYKLDGTILWISDSTVNLSTSSIVNGIIGVSDFNQDGIPEVYISNKIFNARNGKKLCDGGNNGKGLNLVKGSTESFTIAANLDLDNSDLELAAGHTIYKVNISNPDSMVGNQMIPYNIAINGQFEDGPTSVADINLDGKLDVIVSVPGNNNIGLLYVYHLEQNAVRLLGMARPPAAIEDLQKDLFQHLQLGL